MMFFSSPAPTFAVVDLVGARGKVGIGRAPHVCDRYAVTDTIRKRVKISRVSASAPSLIDAHSPTPTHPQADYGRLPPRGVCRTSYCPHLDSIDHCKFVLQLCLSWSFFALAVLSSTPIECHTVLEQRHIGKIGAALDYNTQASFESTLRTCFPADNALVGGSAGIPEPGRSSTSWPGPVPA